MNNKKKILAETAKSVAWSSFALAAPD